MSSIFTEARRSSMHNSLGESPGGSNSEDAQTSKQTLKMNIPLNDQQTAATENTDQPENSTSSLETHREPEEEHLQHQSSVFSVFQSSPAIPSRILRPSHPPTELSSPMRDPRLLQAELRAPETPTLHRRQPPRYARDSWSPSLDKRGGARRSEDEPRRALKSQKSLEKPDESRPARMSLD